MAKKETITSPYSAFREDVLKKLLALGYIKAYEVVGSPLKTFEIELSYKDGEGAVTDVKIYSTPGRRWYTASSKLKPVLGGLGVGILTTPEGIMTNKEAFRKHIGGELLFEIW